MENNSLTEPSPVNETNNSNIELASLVETSQRGFVPKIRIRLRPQLVQSSTVDSQESGCNTTSLRNICDGISLVQSNNDINNWNSDKRCYKTLEDSGGGGKGNPADLGEFKNHFMIHGINLRSRPQKLTIKSSKTKSDSKEKKKLNLLIQPKTTEFIQKTKLKSIGKKDDYPTIMLDPSTEIDKVDKSIPNNKLSRKQITKNRNETSMSNINLKELINQENFMKFPSDIQWQLVNLLPNCDKPKISSEPDSCKCTDYIYNSNDNCQILPNLGFSVLNNEFLGKALTKFSLKMGQCDLINILNSERENLRSRPLTILNDDVLVQATVENDTEINQVTSVNAYEEDCNKVLDEVKSNSSATTTETVEMNGIGNIDDKGCIEFQEHNKFDLCETSQLAILDKELKQNSNINDHDPIKIDEKLELSIITENLPKEENIDVENPQCFTNLDQAILVNVEEKGSYTPNISVEYNSSRSTNSEFIDESRRKRGRKRKLFTPSTDLQIIPIKRSNRSTAGKRPARLDSESPPMSPNIFTINEKKINIKCKKYKDQIQSNKKHKLKYTNCSDQLDNLIKMELKSNKKLDISHDSSKNFKTFPSSPDSLFSVHTESDLSPLSKPSPNGSSLFNNIARSNLVPSHINSIQTLSPSWSCTSESTTPSAKSDYGHNQTTKLISNMPLNVTELPDQKGLVDSEIKQVQRMPPPRQTLTLAAMREKMRAKKLAKEDNRKCSNSSNRKSFGFLNNQRHKKQNVNTILKEEEDDFKLMEKMISNSDDLLNNSQESLLEFFMGNNYEFDTTTEQCSNINSINCKPSLQKKNNLKTLTSIKEKINKIPVSLNANHLDNNFDENNVQTNRIHLNETKSQFEKIINPILENSLLNNQNNKESSSMEKSFNDAISYVLQKLNLSKDNNGVLSHNPSGKSSLPNAYLVDSNGLTTALSIIQSLNPGAKVTTQQFYLVNSGPQLILQPNPPLAIAAEKVTSNSNQLGFHAKVSLAPKIVNPVSGVNQLSNVIRDHLSPNNNSLTGMSLNKVPCSQPVSEKSSIQTTETIIECHQSSSLKVPVTEAKNTFMVSSITPNISNNQSRSLHLQTISTPQPIGFVQPVQQSLPSLFPSQLRFMQPSLSNSATPNAISFLTSNNATCNTSIVNANQPPKLLFLCPTVPNNSNLVTASNVLNQEQKYLLLSKQPDKQATIQLVSSQGLWQQLNPNIISQPNNVLVMQSQPIKTVYESLICPNTYLPAVSPINWDYSLNERKNLCSTENPQISTPAFKEQIKQPFTSIESTSSSLIIDSRSFVPSTKAESSLETNNTKGRLATTESSMTTSLSNHACQSVNSSFSFFPPVQSVTSINENNGSTDESNSAPLTDKFKSPVLKSDQLDMLQSSQDVNLS